jgi:hypothetical protein
MSLLNFSEDLILKIWQMIKNDNIMCSLVLGCKQFRDIGFKFGWLHSIHFKHNDNLNEFIKFYSRPNIFLSRFKITGMFDPYLTVLGYNKIWPKEIEFERCSISNFDNIPVSPTERLIIRDLQRRRSGGPTITVNWSSLPNLKVLDIYAPDLDFNGMELCKNLEIIRIDLDRIRFLPVFFANFPNLELIATTCVAIERFHFLSKKLRVCIVPKKYDFISDSLLVPKSHLEINYSMNIQSIDI